MVNRQSTTERKSGTGSAQSAGQASAPACLAQVGRCPRFFRALRRSSGQAFTLIELLVAIFIIAILITLVIGVSNYVFEEAGRKETQATQAVVMQAIEAYKDVTGYYPPDNTDPSYPPLTAKTCLMWHLKADGGSYNNAKPTQARIRKATAPILLKLSAEAMNAGNLDQLFDGFGNAMDYVQDGGLGGRPVLISAGDDLADTADDIRSDGS